MRPTLRLATFALLLAAGLFCLHVMAAAPKIAVQLDAANVGPRTVEDATEKAVVRDYAGAWQSLADALESNRTELLAPSFVGFARDQFRQAIAQQKQLGLRTRYVDRGHRLQAVFYSPEGASMELRDTAQLEMQVLDGNRVLYSRPLTAHYIVLMTPAADRWQVRLLQEIPNP